MSSLLNSWSHKLRFHDHTNDQSTVLFNFDDALISSVGSNCDDLITNIYVFKTPLNEKQFSNSVFFHSFVTFKTLKNVWWSFEKNTSFIEIQQGLSLDTIRDRLGSNIRCKTNYWNPTLVDEDTCRTQSVSDVIKFIFQNSEHMIEYRGASNNCQVFCEMIFNRFAASKTLYYGLLPSTARFVGSLVGFHQVTGINQALASIPLDKQ